MNLITAVSKRIDEILSEKKKSWYWLANNSGIPRGTISDIKYNKNKGVNLSTLIVIIRVLGITVTGFLIAICLKAR